MINCKLWWKILLLTPSVALGLIFCVRQLVEKTIEHRSKVFLLFVDLCKAYDSVPRQAFCVNMVCLVAWLIWSIFS